MSLGAKIALVVGVLDELVTIGYLTHNADKLQALEMVRGVLYDFHLPPTPTKADTSIYSMQILAEVKNVDLNTQLSGLATLAEKALSELHNQYVNTI